jgi:hypothetical protein
MNLGKTSVLPILEALIGQKPSSDGVKETQKGAAVGANVVFPGGITPLSTGAAVGSSEIEGISEVQNLPSTILP